MTRGMTQYCSIFPRVMNVQRGFKEQVYETLPCKLPLAFESVSCRLVPARIGPKEEQPGKRPSLCPLIPVQHEQRSFGRQDAAVAFNRQCERAAAANQRRS